MPERKASKVIDVFHSRLEQAAIEQRCFILIVPTYMIIFSIEIYDKNPAIASLKMRAPDYIYGRYRKENLLLMNVNTK